VPDLRPASGACQMGVDHLPIGYVKVVLCLGWRLDLCGNFGVGKRRFTFVSHEIKGLVPGGRMCHAWPKKRVTTMDDSVGSPIGSPTPNRERRAVPRYILIATAEIVEPVSEVHISGRISEISRKGCYVDILNPLPVGTLIRLRVSRDQGAFSSPGKIIYIQEGMGMGVAFIDPAADQLKILESWLADLAS
jgi:hypothetical protein